MSLCRVSLEGEDGEVWVDPAAVMVWMAFPCNEGPRTVLYAPGMKRIAIVRQSPSEVASAFARTMRRGARS